MKKYFDMKIGNIAWGLVLLCTLVACKEQKETQMEGVKKEQEVSSTPLGLQVFSYQDIAEHAIVQHGCLCTFGNQKDQYFFADNRHDQAVIKLDGQFVVLKAIKADEVDDQDNVTKVYENEQYKVSFKGVRNVDNGSDSGTMLSGRLTVMGPNSTRFEEKVFGICGC